VQKHYYELIQAKISETFFRRSYQKQNKGALLRPRPMAVKIKDIYPRILLAAMLNHPHIYEALEESFGRFDIIDQAQSRLRQAIISALDDDPALDREGLRNHLKSQGFEEEMGDILVESVYVHASFAAPDADSGQVGQKWMEFWQDVQGRNLDREISSGWRQVASEEDEEKLRNMVQARASERAH